MQDAYRVLRQRVLSMHPGVPLPPVPALMRELSVSQVTLDKACDLLEQQGLIERRRGKGVFAASRLATGEIAIVLSQVNLEPTASPTYVRQCALLRRRLHEVNAKWTVNVHLGVSRMPGPDFPATLDLLEPAVLPRLRGVLSFHDLFAVETRLTQAGVPVVYLGGGPTHGTGAYLDHEQMLRDGIRHLAECGCRSVCLLHTRYVGKRPQGQDRTPVAAATAAECGLAFRDEWLGHEEGGWSERHGYDLFLRVWDKPEHPDGVLVDDDILCHGVLRAVQELRLELPRDLRLVSQASRGFGFPYPRPLSRLEYDLDGCADKAVRLLETLAQGQSPECPVEWVRATLVKGETT
jgi:hypothetical protein